MSQLRASQEMLLQHGVSLSVRVEFGLSGCGHNPENMRKRLKTLEARSAQRGYFILTENQIMALEKMKSQKEAHGEIETYHPDYLSVQDTYFVGSMKGGGHFCLKMIQRIILFTP
jgi:hypothetical protein